MENPSKYKFGTQRAKSSFEPSHKVPQLLPLLLVLLVVLSLLLLLFACFASRWLAFAGDFPFSVQLRQSSMSVYVHSLFTD